MDSLSVKEFQHIVLRYFKKNGRDLPWRNTDDPWCILVSEVMLQQTQVERVRDKYQLFIGRFPDPAACTAASLADVLQVWQGLGYNRRAGYLQTAAEMICTRFYGRVPDTIESLAGLPGIGTNTAGAILVYAFNFPAVFIETNIRTVMLYHFFNTTERVSDREIFLKVSETLDKKNPRRWYWALMDYGVFLKKTAPGQLEKSLHYKKQSPFRGSRREIRGKVLRLLLQGNELSPGRIAGLIGKETELVMPVLDQMTREHLLQVRAGNYSIADKR